MVADQIGKLAADSAKSAVNTRDLSDKTLVEIEKGNTITRTTADAFNQIITDMESFAELAENTMEKANSQACLLYTSSGKRMGCSSGASVPLEV